MRTVSFSFYHDTYHGELSEDVFNRHVYPAAALVDDLIPTCPSEREP